MRLQGHDLRANEAIRQHKLWKFCHPKHLSAKKFPAKDYVFEFFRVDLGSFRAPLTSKETNSRLPHPKVIHISRNFQVPQQWTAKPRSAMLETEVVNWAKNQGERWANNQLVVVWSKSLFLILAT